FQAEDGIRDLIVTGVQTCALPISDRDPAGARGTRNAIGSGIARAGWSLTKRRGLPHLQPSPIGGFAWRAAAARSVDEPRSAHRTYAYATFLALERTQGCAARISRGQLLDTSRLGFPGQLSGAAR